MKYWKWVIKDNSRLDRWEKEIQRIKGVACNRKYNVIKKWRWGSRWAIKECIE